jgi:hypothetical protein
MGDGLDARLKYAGHWLFLHRCSCCVTCMEAIDSDKLIVLKENHFNFAVHHGIRYGKPINPP